MWPVVFFLVVLHGPDGREIDISRGEITSLNCKIPNTDNKLYTEGANAVVSLTDGKNIAVRETCEQIKKLLEEDKE